MLGKIATRSSCCFKNLWQQLFAGCWFTVFGIWHFCIVSIIWKFKTWLTGWMANTGYAALLMSECMLPSSLCPGAERQRCSQFLPYFLLLQKLWKNLFRTIFLFYCSLRIMMLFPGWMFLLDLTGWMFLLFPLYGTQKIIPPYPIFQITDLGPYINLCS